GGDGDAVDGFGGLAETGRAPPVRKSVLRDCAWVWWADLTCGAVASRGVGKSRSLWCGYSGDWFVCVGMRVDLFETCAVARLGGSEHVHAMLGLRRCAVDRRVRNGGSATLSFRRSDDAVVACSGVPNCFWVGDWIYVLHVHFEEQHGREGSDVCVCESRCGVA